MKNNLALDFGVDDQFALQPQSAIPALVVRFEKSMQEDGSPVRAIRHQPAKPARFAPFPERLDGKLRSALAVRGIENLYTHQSAADRTLAQSARMSLSSRPPPAARRSATTCRS